MTIMHIYENGASGLGLVIVFDYLALCLQADINLGLLLSVAISLLYIMYSF